MAMMRALPHGRTLWRLALSLTLSVAAGGLGGATAIWPVGAAARPAHRPRARYRPLGCRISGGEVAHFQGPDRRLVALSFDDGPSSYTRQFVRMIAANHVVATFFMIGEQISPAYRSTMREELRDGDALGDHTWSHPDLVGLGSAFSQIKGTREAIRRETGYTPCVFRPPYGAYDSAVVHTARTLGLATIMWDVDPRDWSLPGVGAIEQRVLAQVQPGSIILSHDGGGPRQETLQAYPYIIRQLRRRGYRFVTVPQLLGFKTVYRRCMQRCRGAAIKGRPPRGSIVEAG